MDRNVAMTDSDGAQTLSRLSGDLQNLISRFQSVPESLTRLLWEIREWSERIDEETSPKPTSAEALSIRQTLRNHISSTCTNMSFLLQLQEANSTHGQTSVTPSIEIMTKYLEVLCAQLARGYLHLTPRIPRIPAPNAGSPLVRSSIGRMSTTKEKQTNQVGTLTVNLSDGSEVNYETARQFMDYYCRKFDFPPPEVDYKDVKSPRGTCEAGLSVASRRIGIGVDETREKALEQAYLDVTLYLEKCDKELWQGFAKAVKTDQSVESTEQPESGPSQAHAALSVHDEDNFMKYHFPEVDRPLTASRSYSWTIRYWSKLERKIDSPDFECGGVKWFIVAYPKGKSSNDEDVHVSLYLVAHQVSPTPLHVQFAFAISNERNPTNFIANVAEHRFQRDAPDFGFKWFCLERAVSRPRGGQDAILEGDSLDVNVFLRIFSDQRQPSARLALNVVQLSTIPTLREYFEQRQLTRGRGPTRSSFNPKLLEKVSLHFGDISKVSVDAIVNPTNFTFLQRGFVGYQIHAAAGPRLMDECATLGTAKSGEARITKGYNLPCKHVIHAVGPIYSKSQEDNPAGQLLSCYENCLNLAVQHKIKTIAFCAISTGGCGYPIIEATNVALHTVRTWLEFSGLAHELERVVFVVASERNLHIYEELMPQWFPLA